jgi:hypothetical protein
MMQVFETVFLDLIPLLVASFFALLTIEGDPCQVLCQNQTICTKNKDYNNSITKRL